MFRLVEIGRHFSAIVTSTGNSNIRDVVSVDWPPSVTHHMLTLYELFATNPDISTVQTKCIESSDSVSYCLYMVRKYASSVVNCGPVDTMMGTGSPGNHLILF